jgi:type IV pilus assembly protein PilE
MSVHTSTRTSTASPIAGGLGVRRLGGFTLIELMIAVVVIAILAAIAITSYYRYVLRSNRAAAEDLMFDMASAQERYMIDARQYSTSNAVLGYGTLPQTVAPNYQIAVTTGNGPPPTYSITATPIGTQTRDTTCGTLTLNSDGTKTVSGTDTHCWK